MKSQDSKVIWTTQPEKPGHYSYLKEFRVEQCPLFLQHKCTQHRPYTCFHWHFLNQRRRRPIRKRDGSFNYSPDNYCTKFDENTGICPDGDDCPYLHRTAGDTERRYHLRYYKTGVCVHETDTRGYCVKNGPHCAFAHGVDDVRPPVYDLRELHQSIEGGSLTGEGVQQLLQDTALINGTSVGLAGPAPAHLVPNSLDKERNMVTDDPRWQDTAYVLANYKTEQCKRPPRLCRQGYACPQHHNSRDRRRPPKKYKYRSTACPNVKHSDEWGEPGNCESGDACQYCHTRTEQQFHPEIYKSSKCNDIQQTGYCPRGVFCAFAHVDQEMTAVRETAANENCGGTSLADILQSALPPENPPSSSTSSSVSSNALPHSSQPNSSSQLAEISRPCPMPPSAMSDSRATTNGFISPPHSGIPPIGSKPRHFSGNNGTNTPSSSSSTPNNTGLLGNTSLNNNNGINSCSVIGTSSSSNMLPAKDVSLLVSSSNSIFSGMLAPTSTNNNNCSYLKAPGSERENDSNFKKQLAAAAAAVKDTSMVIGTERSSSLENTLDKLKVKSSNSNCSSLFLGSSSALNNGVLGSSFSTSHHIGSSIALPSVSTVSPLAPPFYPTNNTVESVVGNALDEISLSELSAAIEPDFNPISSSLNSGLASSGLIGCSAPVNIPGSNGGNSSGAGSFHDRSTLLSNLTNAVSASPSAAFNPSIFHNNTNSIEQNNLAAAFLRATNGASLSSNNQSLGQQSQQNVSDTNSSSNHLFDSNTTVSSNSIFSTNFPPHNAITNNLVNNINSMSSHASLSQSPLLTGSGTPAGSSGFAPSGAGTGGAGIAASNSEMWRLREEIITNRAKLASWEEGIQQARTACEAWKREVDDAHRKIKMAEQGREEVLTKLRLVQQELDACRAGKVLSPYVEVLNPHCELDSLPRHVLQQLSTKLRSDIEAVDKALNNSLPSEWSNVPNW